MLKTTTTALLAASALLVVPAAVGQEVVGRALSADGDLNVTGYVNAFDPAAGGTAFSSGFDAFAIYQRNSGGFISFDLVDDTTVVVNTDTGAFGSGGIVKAGNTAPFFGIEDTRNNDNDNFDPVNATFTFDTSSIVGPATIRFDLAAYGDFEDGVFSSNRFGEPAGTPGIADTLVFSTSVDGGPAVTLADATVLAGPSDAEITRTYTFEDGSTDTLNDPLNLNTLAGSAALSNDFQTFEFTLADAGSSLSFGIEAFFDGGGEAVALQNLSISGVVPEPASLALLALGGTALLGRRRRVA